MVCLGGNLQDSVALTFPRYRPIALCFPRRYPLRPQILTKAQVINCILRTPELDRLQCQYVEVRYALPQAQEADEPPSARPTTPPNGRKPSQVTGCAKLCSSRAREASFDPPVLHQGHWKASDSRRLGPQKLRYRCATEITADRL